MGTATGGREVGMGQPNGTLAAGATRSSYKPESGNEFQAAVQQRQGQRRRARRKQQPGPRTLGEGRALLSQSVPALGRLAPLVPSSMDDGNRGMLSVKSTTMDMTPKYTPKKTAPAAAGGGAAAAEGAVPRFFGP